MCALNYLLNRDTYIKMVYAIKELTYGFNKEANKKKDKKTTTENIINPAANLLQSLLATSYLHALKPSVSSAHHCSEPAS